MRFSWYEAVVLFVLWAIQLIVPSIREEIIFVYIAWIGFCLLQIISGSRKPQAFRDFTGVLRSYILVAKPSSQINPQEKK
jgi:hypothetical protein